jgi:hypothetical protein
MTIADASVTSEQTTMSAAKAKVKKNIAADKYEN